MSNNSDKFIDVVFSFEKDKKISEVFDKISRTHYIPFFTYVNKKVELNLLKNYKDIIKSFNNKKVKIIENENDEGTIVKRAIIYISNRIKIHFDNIRRNDEKNLFVIEFKNLLKQNIKQAGQKISDVDIEYIDSNKLTKQIVEVGYISSFDPEHKNVFDAINNVTINSEFLIKKVEIKSNDNINNALNNWIDQYNLFIVDLSLFGEKKGIPNVYYEYGLIEGKGKKVVVICNEKDWKNKYVAESIFSDKGTSTFVILYSDYSELADKVMKELFEKTA
jgi:hypothetical protein